MRAITLALVGVASVLAAGPVRGGTIDFTNPSATSVLAGTTIFVDVEMTIDSGVLTTFDFAKINIGSPDPNDASTPPTDLGFVFDSNWTTNFDDGNTLLFNDGFFYAQEVDIESSSSDAIAASTLTVGVLSIDTTGMSPGFYDVVVDGDFDGESEVVNMAEGSAGDVLHGRFTYEITPEPASAILMALAIPALARRRLRG